MAKESLLQSYGFWKGHVTPTLHLWTTHDNQNELAAVTTTYTGALENWEEAWSMEKSIFFSKSGPLLEK